METQQFFDLAMLVVSLSFIIFWVWFLELMPMDYKYWFEDDGTGLPFFPKFIGLIGFILFILIVIF